MNIPKFAVIGGTGTGDLLTNDDRFITIKEKLEGENNPFGDDVNYLLVEPKLESDSHPKQFIFLDRHNSSGEFRLPCHLNHEAYMWLLARLDITHIIAISAVGGINGHIKPELHTGSIIMPDDYFDLTGKSYTFAKRLPADPLAFHRALRPPFCSHLRHVLSDKDIRNGGILGCGITGPRYENVIEAKILKNQGASLLGMSTIVGEAPLAQEANLCYVAICLVTNMPLEDESTDAQSISRTGHELNILLTDKIIAAMKKIAAAEMPLCRCGEARSVLAL